MKQQRQRRARARDACEAIKGCEVAEAQCYCACVGHGQTKVADTTAPICDCECGGGRPAICRATKAPAPKAAAGKCDALTEPQCLSSPRCVLVLLTPLRPAGDGEPGDNAVYQCRAPQDACEAVHIQGTFGKKEDAERAHAACNAIKGCEVAPGQCYCPGPASCVCAGGPPPICRKKP